MAGEAVRSVHLIVGAGGGVGSEVARRLAYAGAAVVLSGRDPAKLERVAAATHGLVHAADASVPAQVDELFAMIASRFGRLDGIAHCAGSLLLKPAHATTDADWEKTISANLTSAFYVLRGGVRAMSGTGGSIVFVSSAAARVGMANHEAIAAAKAGIIGLTLSAAATYANRGIRVNCIAPGLVETPLTERITGSSASRQASEAMHPMGRLGAAEDIARAIEWFLAKEQSWVTGQVLGVDGGLGSVRAR
ncbi:MAG TPA: oxidoreductase [Solibacterales bacterium]|nr:oxidoreductase [Bryobacterales bacterium]